MYACLYRGRLLTREESTSSVVLTLEQTIGFFGVSEPVRKELQPKVVVRLWDDDKGEDDLVRNFLISLVGNDGGGVCGDGGTPHPPDGGALSKQVSKLDSFCLYNNTLVPELEDMF